MTESWATMRAADVRLGDRVRLASGQEILVSRIEPNFMGMEAMVAFIEDTPTRWFKQPVPQATEVEVIRKTLDLAGCCSRLSTCWFAEFLAWPSWCSARTWRRMLNCWHSGTSTRCCAAMSAGCVTSRPTGYCLGDPVHSGY